ncbi:hypothetical protein [Maribacter sp. 2307ULW6-5]|uniref:hypothetical protein n=1 Tax=Maribacter sp. 2307ULW6-5 TaxID=3386275 RepID=UPI0039BCC135
MEDLRSNELLHISGGYGWYPGYDAKARYEADMWALHQIGDYLRGTWIGLTGSK